MDVDFCFYSTFTPSTFEFIALLLFKVGFIYEDGLLTNPDFVYILGWIGFFTSVVLSSFTGLIYVLIFSSFVVFISMAFSLTTILDEDILWVSVLT